LQEEGCGGGGGDEDEDTSFNSRLALVSSKRFNGVFEDGDGGKFKSCIFETVGLVWFR
jgi:hypothetical protein